MSISTTYPETLILQAGCSFRGRFKRLERGRTRDGEERAIAILEADGREHSLWLHETALRGQFRDCRPDPGETIIVIKGAEKVESASGRSYWPFKVIAPDRPSETPPDWNDPLLGDDTEQVGALTDADKKAFNIIGTGRPAAEPVAKEPKSIVDRVRDDDIPL